MTDYVSNMLRLMQNAKGTASNRVSPRQKYNVEIDCNDKFKAPLELACGGVSHLLVLCKLETRCRIKSQTSDILSFCVSVYTER